MVNTTPDTIPAPPHTSARPGTYQKLVTMLPASSSAAGARPSAGPGGLWGAQHATSAVRSMKLTTLCFFMIVSPRGVRDARLALVDSIPSPERLIQDAHQRERS